MRCRGAVIKQAPGRYEIVDLDVDDPRQDEIRVRLVAAGLCHSDDHVATGDLPVGIYPFAGGHEGAGIVESVGPNTATFAAGDKIVLLDRTGPQGELDRMLQPGQRYPYTPPSGCVLAVWLSDAEIAEWLADYPEVSMAESLEDLQSLVDTVRERGYIVERMSDLSVGALTMLARLS